MSSITDSYCSTTALFDDQSGVEESCAEEELRQQDVSVLTAQDRATPDTGLDKVKRALYVSNAKLPRLRWMGCGQCHCRQAIVLGLGIFLTLSALTLVIVGAIRSRDHAMLKVVHVKHPVNLKTETNIGEANLTIAQLLRLTSLSLGKPITQSSFPPSLSEVNTQKTAAGGGGGEGGERAALAVDGDAKTCSSTALELNPWFRVDLQQDTSVASVRILKSISSTAASGLSVKVRPSFNGTSGPAECRSATRNPDDGSNAGLDVRVTCQPGTIGRYVTIQLPPSSGDIPRKLALCEVLVFRG